MKAKEIYDKAKKLMFEKSSSKDYDYYYIENLNALLSDNFVLNNKIRESKNLLPLKEIPIILKGDDDVPFEQIMCSNILPRGLAANLFVDDDMAKYNKYYVDYMNSREVATPCISVPILDVF